MRIVLDTNVIISALVFDGVPQHVFDLVTKGRCDFYFSAAIQNEVERVLKDKFGWSTEVTGARLRQFFNWGTPVYPQMTLTVIKDDPDDDRILECAVGAEAQTIISGDRHLLQLGSFQSITIQTPRQFLDSQGWTATGPQV